MLTVPTIQRASRDQDALCGFSFHGMPRAMNDLHRLGRPPLTVSCHGAAADGR